MSKDFNSDSDDFDVNEDEFDTAFSDSQSESEDSAETEIGKNFNVGDESEHDAADDGASLAADEADDDDYDDYEPNHGKKSKAPIIVLGALAVFAILAVVAYIVLDGMGFFAGETKGLISLGDYKSYTYDEYVIATPSDAEIEDYYNSIVSYYSSTSYAVYNELPEKADDVVAKGDTVNIDYTGYLDGEAFDGGSATGYNLTIGSNTFIDGFEDGLIGHKVGESFDITITFPDPYTLNTDLSGAETVFTVTINYFSEAEPLYVTMGYDSLEACYSDISDYLVEQEQSDKSDYLTEKMNEYIEDVVETSEFDDISDKATELYNTTYSALEKYYTAQGYDMDTVATGSGYSSLSDMQAYYKSQAEESVKMQLVLTAIAEAEGLEFTDEIYEQTARSYIGSDSTSVEDFQTDYDNYMGTGRFRELMFESYVIETIFGKYAAVEAAE